MTPSAFHEWLHSLPAAHVQALRDFRRCARAAHPGPDYLAKALDAGELHTLLRPASDPRKALTHHEAGAVVAAMPREFVLAIHVATDGPIIEGEFVETKLVR